MSEGVCYLLILLYNKWWCLLCLSPLYNYILFSITTTTTSDIIIIIIIIVIIIKSLACQYILESRER